MPAPVIFNGESGKAWTNDSSVVAYQFFANWSNTCGTCAQFDHAIRLGIWPIPYHRGCRCMQQVVLAGAKAEPWVDFREVIDGLDPHQRAEVVGVANLRLIESGVVTWDDVVTPHRVRLLREVVSREKLTIRTMTGVGVPERIARDAYATVHTPAHELAAKQRAKLVESILGMGVAPEQLKAMFGEALAVRIGVAGPSGVSKVGPGRGGADWREVLKWARKTTAPAVPKVVAKPKAEELTPENFEAKVSASIDAALAARRNEDISGIIIDAIKAHARPSGEAQVHGMAEPEEFRSVRFGGIDWHYSGEVTEGSAIYRTLRILAITNVKMPDRLTAATKEIYFTTQANKNDAYWATKYKDFPGSHATGGGGNNVVYKGDTTDRASVAHEAGHNLAEQLYGSHVPGRDYARAMAGKEPPVSDYAKNSPSEDFAEAVRLYVGNPKAMKADHPARYEVIHKIMTDPNYGG